MPDLAPSASRSNTSRKRIDGDTFILTDTFDREITINLLVDAPEIGQPYGEEARDRLKQLLDTDSWIMCKRMNSGDLRCSNPVTIRNTRLRREKLPMLFSAIVEIPRLDSSSPRHGGVAETMLREGLAWHPVPPWKNSTEAKARKEKKNLWKRGNAIAPWFWHEAMHFDAYYSAAVKLSKSKYGLAQERHLVEIKRRRKTLKDTDAARARFVKHCVESPFGENVFYINLADRLKTASPSAYQHGGYMNGVGR